MLALGAKDEEKAAQVESDAKNEHVDEVEKLRRPSTERHGRVKQAETRVDSGLISQRMSGRMLPL